MMQRRDCSLLQDRPQEPLPLPAEETSCYNIRSPLAEALGVIDGGYKHAATTGLASKKFSTNPSPEKSTRNFFPSSKKRRRSSDTTDDLEVWIEKAKSTSAANDISSHFVDLTCENDRDIPTIICA